MVGLHVDEAGGAASLHGVALPLSAQEVRVLGALAAAQGAVLGRAALARRAGLLGASARRPDHLLVGVRRALGTEAVRTVRGRGWALEPQAVAPVVVVPQA